RACPTLRPIFDAKSVRSETSDGDDGNQNRPVRRGLWPPLLASALGLWPWLLLSSYAGYATGTPMNLLASQIPSRKLIAPLLAGLFAVASSSRAADEPDAAKEGPKGAAVTVLKAAKYCFPAIVDASGIIIPREETMVRPERAGMKVADILA